MEHTFTSIIPLLAAFTPMVAALLIPLLRKDPDKREAVSVIASVITFLLVLSMAPTIMAGQVIRLEPARILPGFGVSLRVDGFGMLFGLVSSFLWIFTTLYSIGYMRGLDEHAQTRYYTCFALTLGSALGVAFSGSLFTLYLCYELVSIFTYPLVMHHEDSEGQQGARKYLVYLMGAGKLFFYRPWCWSMSWPEIWILVPSRF